MVRTMTSLLTCLIVAIVGCGGGGTSVQGKITINGQPIEKAEIAFVPIDSKTGERIGTVVTNGTYELRDSPQLKAGDYQVQILAFKPTGKKIWDGMGDGSNKTMVDDLVQYVPEKYNNASVLKVTLKSGANNYDTDIQAPAK